jgi:hypothetical protein
MTSPRRLLDPAGNPLLPSRNDSARGHRPALGLKAWAGRVALLLGVWAASAVAPAVAYAPAGSASPVMPPVSVYVKVPPSMAIVPPAGSNIHAYSTGKAET